MGVKGLWSLLSSFATPTQASNLEFLVVAVDLSGWIHSALYHQNEREPNLFLVSLLRKICRLVEMRMFPVFVLDNPIPSPLKLRTIELRRRMRERRKAATAAAVREAELLKASYRALQLDAPPPSPSNDAELTPELSFSPWTSPEPQASPSPLRLEAAVAAGPPGVSAQSTLNALARSARAYDPAQFVQREGVRAALMHARMSERTAPAAAPAAVDMGDFARRVEGLSALLGGAARPQPGLDAAAIFQRASLRQTVDGGMFALVSTAEFAARAAEPRPCAAPGSTADGINAALEDTARAALGPAAEPSADIPVLSETDSLVEIGTSSTASEERSASPPHNSSPEAPPLKRPPPTVSTTQAPMPPVPSAPPVPPMPPTPPRTQPRELASRLEEAADRAAAATRQQVPELSRDITRNAIGLILSCGFPVLRAARGVEAEKVCAVLARDRLARAVISEDSDTAVYGAAYVLRSVFGVTSRPPPPGFGAAETLSARRLAAAGIGREALVAFALLLGCDFAPGVPGVGPISAAEVVAALLRTHDGDPEAALAALFGALSTWLTACDSADDALVEAELRPALRRIRGVVTGNMRRAGIQDLVGQFPARAAHEFLAARDPKEVHLADIVQDIDDCSFASPFISARDTIAFLRRHAERPEAWISAFAEGSQLCNFMEAACGWSFNRTREWIQPAIGAWDAAFSSRRAENKHFEKAADREAEFPAEFSQRMQRALQILKRRFAKNEEKPTGVGFEPTHS
eukprot:gnl/Chilomastix_cuspidata/2179.p1 GENE.gnl/Chilomastix_cuspidata/2179~~gnl/Chilomastix_cuspidata/2179.p1  ORF type:complete len:750 (+),score=188.87 gnl/Chilomastix_cuspidata/2179:46-2295(+)